MPDPTVPPAADAGASDSITLCLRATAAAAPPPHARDSGPTQLAHPDHIAAPCPAPPRPLPDVRLPGYEILDELGRGGMGVVYKARQLGLNRIVALKMLPPGGGAPDDLMRFRLEALAVARLRHPNIVQVFEIGEHESRPYFSLEFMEGGTLEDHLAGRPQPPRDAAGTVAALAEAIHAAHQNFIVHRDLKPRNVLLGRDGTPKVTDFGLAKRLDSQMQLTRTGVLAGTPAYMAPEQVRGDSREVGPAADIYALGVILYQMLTGRLPFEADHPLDLMDRVATRDPDRPRALQRTVPRDLETICLKCLRKEPSRRYGSARDLADDLRRFLVGQPIHARPVDGLEKTILWARRRPALAALLAGLALAVAGLAGDAAWYTQRLHDERDLARAAAHQAEEQSRRAEWLAYTGTIALAQREWKDNDVAHARRLLSECGTAFRHWEYDYLSRLCAGSPLTLAGPEQPVVAIAYSHDGRLLAGAVGNTVRVWETDTGEERFVFRGHTGPVRAVAFSPNDRFVASAGGDDERPGEAKVWELADGAIVLDLKGHQRPVTCLAFSPDGQRLATGGQDAMAHVWDVNTGTELRNLPHPGAAVFALAFGPRGERLVTGSGEVVAGRVKVWDLADGRMLRNFRGYGSVGAVAYSPDGRWVVSAGRDRMVRVWDVGTGKEATTFHGHTRPVLGLAFHPDGQRIASVGRDQVVRVWEARTGQEVLALRGHTGPIHGVAFRPDGQRLATAGREVSGRGEVRVWNAAAGQEATTLTGPLLPLFGLALSPDGRHLAAVGGREPDPAAAGAVWLWDLAKRDYRRLRGGHTEAVRAAAFSPDGQFLATAGLDQTVWIWNVADNRKRSLALPGQALCVAIGPDGRLLATGGTGGVRIWDFATGEERFAPGPAVMVHGIAFRPGGKQLASACEDGGVRVWDLETRRLVLSLAGHGQPAFAVAYSRDGTRLASTGVGSTARVCDADTGEEVCVLQGHQLRVRSIAFSPDGRRLVTGSGDRTVKVWDAGTGLETITLKGHEQAVHAVAFSADGRRIVSASADRTVKIWDSSPLSSDDKVTR